MLLRIRHYKDGDEKEIADVLTKSFDTFRIFGMDGDKWLKYQEIDTGFYLHNAIVIESDDGIVGHAQIICRDLKIGESTFVRVGGVGNICVLPEYRKKGMATMIMNYVQQCVQNLELPISALLVQEKSGMQFYFEKNKQQMQWKFVTALSREMYDTESSLALVDSGINTRDQAELSVENISYFDQQKFILSLVMRYQAIHDELSQVTDSFGVVTPGINEYSRLLNPQIGAKYRFNKQSYLTANVGKYNRMPSSLALVAGAGLLSGNTNLKKGSALNADVGITYTWYQHYRWLH